MLIWKLSTGGLIVLVEEAVEEFVLDHLAEIVTTTFFLIGLWHLKEIRRDLSSAQVELSAIDSKLNENLNANTNSTNQPTPVRYQNSFKATGVLSYLWKLVAQMQTPTDRKVKKFRKVRSVP
jgi:hypothetical protein